MIKVNLIDGHGSGNVAKINGEGELNVVVHPHPPLNETNSALPFRQYLTDNGTYSGSNDMTVNGSTNNVEFYVTALQDYDIYIKSISFEIADAGGLLNEFGSINELSNGCELYWETQEDGKTIIHEELTTNWKIIRLCGGQPAYGNGNSSFRANNISGNSEGFTPFLDFNYLFGLKYGLRLRKGTLDRLSFVIKDNVSNLDSLNIIAYGIKI